jgi:hypothetical protein
VGSWRETKSEGEVKAACQPIMRDTRGRVSGVWIETVCFVCSVCLLLWYVVTYLARGRQTVAQATRGVLFREPWWLGFSAVQFVLMWA